MSGVGYNDIQSATSLLTRIAFSQGEDADPVATLALWRKTEGFDEDALERAARESADDSIEEIERVIEEGGAFTTAQLREYLEREYLAAAQIFWIVRARFEARSHEAEEKVRKAATDA